MNRNRIVKGIVKIYFLAALAGSFTHIVDAAGKAGLVGWEMWSTPFMIDGLAIIGMVMRGEAFSQRTRRIGFRVQCVMGLFSLIANVYAAHNVGGVIYGVAIVALFIAAEWLSENLESVQVDKDREAKEKRAAAAQKAAATRQRNARRKNREIKTLEAALAKS
jgi:hypothetical protein